MPGPTPQQANAQARAALQQFGDRTQLRGPANAIPAGGGLVTVSTNNIRQIGLTTRIFITGTVILQNTSAAIVNSTGANPPYVGGLANLITNVNLQDPWQNIRYNLPLRDIIYMRSIKDLQPYGAAVTTDTAFGMTNAYGSNKQPATIAASSSSAANAIQFCFEIPFARNAQKGDFRGAILTQSINQQIQLQLTFNTAPIVTSAADPFTAMYSGASGAGTITSGTFYITQEYYTLPAGAGAAWPTLDISTIYRIESFPLVQSLVANTDNIAQVPNYRQIMNAFFVLDNGPAGAAATDLNLLKVFPNANYQIRGLDPLALSFLTRDNIWTDLPLGYYWLDFRDKNLYTPAVGQSSIVPNVATVNSGNQGYLIYESIMASNDVNLAGSV